MVGGRLPSARVGRAGGSRRSWRAVERAAVWGLCLLLVACAHRGDPGLPVWSPASPAPALPPASADPVALARPGPAPAAAAAEPALATPADASAPTSVRSAPGTAAPTALEPPPAPGETDGSTPVFERGLASWYGGRFHGRRTASGERFDRHAFTAAHRTLPLGTRVRVRSVATGHEVVVRINDRGPFKSSRIIDLSEAAMSALGVRLRGVTAVELLPE